MTKTRNALFHTSLALVLGLTFAIAPVRGYAGLIDTDAAQAASERARVRAMLERPELAQALEKMGLPPRDAQARVDAMNDVEVAQLAGRLEAVPAGGALTTQEWLLVIIAILLLVIVL
jgi:hypothetical protein